MENLKPVIQDFFNGLVFYKEGHRYMVNDIPLKGSVSSLVKKFVHQTDWTLVAKLVARGKGIPEEKVLEEWGNNSAVGCAIGSQTHQFAEDKAQNKRVKATTGYEEAVEKFWKNLPNDMELVDTEITMYHKDYLFAGTADLLLRNKNTNSLFIVDWKTNKNLFKNFKFNKMKAPFENLLCTPFNHYQLQLSLYQILLEQIPDIKIKGRKLVWLTPNGKHTIYDCEDYTDLLKQELHKIYVN